ncbi:unnamed protein product, partial [Closterium sp. Naga37s-1]
AEGEALGEVEAGAGGGEVGEGGAGGMAWRLLWQGDTGDREGQEGEEQQHMGRQQQEQRDRMGRQGGDMRQQQGLRRGWDPGLDPGTSFTPCTWEVAAMATKLHPNLVRLLGYCIDMNPAALGRGDLSMEHRTAPHCTPTPMGYCIDMNPAALGRVDLSMEQIVVAAMATKHHPNLVRLLGYCIDMHPAAPHSTTGDLSMEQIVVYEFMANGDLERWVGEGAAQPLGLAERLSVLIGTAHGLEYLHRFGIVHRDIKPANILLDDKLEAKVADFGLLRQNEGTTVGDTRIMGTPGYVDPAYFKSNKATPMADVYSFGILILTTMSGHNALKVDENGNNFNVRKWAESLVAAGKAEELKDPRLDVPADLILRLAQLALRCTGMPTVSRPDMIQVVSELTALRKEFSGEGVI